MSELEKLLTMIESIIEADYPDHIELTREQFDLIQAWVPSSSWSTSPYPLTFGGTPVKVVG